MIFLNHPPNINTSDLMFSIKDKLENRGLFINELILQVYNTNFGKLKYFTIKDLDKFTSDYQSYKINYSTVLGRNLYLIKYLRLINKNLEKYLNEFTVDLSDVNKPKFKNSKILNNKIQNRIDSEVQRYENLLADIFSGGDTSYRSIFTRFEQIQNEEEENAYINYVDIGYVDQNYINPQQ